MRIQKELVRIMARRGEIVASKQIIAEKQIKYTKGSTSENKISRKHNFLYVNTPKSTGKHPKIIKIKHNKKKKLNTTGLIHVTWKAKIYAMEILVEVS